MLFYFLDLDYDQPWDKIKEHIALCMGDFRFDKLNCMNIESIAYALWLNLNGKSLKKTPGAV